MRITSFLAALFAVFLLAGQADKARAGLIVSITVEPPVLPVYVQPPVPGPGYIWTPGYWAWDDDSGDYYWVPGAWVLAPEPGLLWTPGYWGWSNGVYVWNAGYWGPHVGFYGGVCYGFGYGGVGFGGGYWAGGVYTYNRSVTNIGVNVNVNVYNKTVINNNVTNVSYNGGNGGIKAQPTAQELQHANERHIPASSEQLQHQQLAAKNPDLRLANNRGKPSIAATSKAGDFSKEHTFAAKSAGPGFKPASLSKTQGGAAGLNKAQGGTTGHNFNASKGNGNSGFKANTLSRTGTGSNTPANRFQSNTNTGNNASNRGASLNNKARRPGPGPSRPAPRAVTKAPPPKVNNYKPH
jgi:WXXGXW repeat (2 copies)